MADRTQRGSDARDLDLVPIMNLVTILIPFLIMGAQFVSIGVVDATLPSLVMDEPDERDEDSLSLTVVITAEGFLVTHEGRVLPGGGAGPTVPCRQEGCPTPDSYDHPTLTRMLADLKDRHPDERQLVLVPDAATPYEVLVGVMDAVREDAGTATEAEPRELFPDIIIAGNGGR